MLDRLNRASCLMIAGLISLVVTATATDGSAGELPKGAFSMPHPHSTNVGSVNELSRLVDHQANVVALSDLTIQYGFSSLMGEPLIAFRGNYQLGETAHLKVSQKCYNWLKSAENSIAGVSENQTAGGFVNVDNVAPFSEAFAKAEILSTSKFEAYIKVREPIFIDAENSTNILMPVVEFAPDTLINASDEMGLFVNGSPAWGKLFKHQGEGFEYYSETFARKVFEVGFEVAFIRLSEPKFDMTSLVRKVNQVCAETMKKKTEKLSDKESDHLERALAEAFDQAESETASSETGAFEGDEELDGLRAEHSKKQHRLSAVSRKLARSSLLKKEEIRACKAIPEPDQYKLVNGEKCLKEGTFSTICLTSGSSKSCSATYTRCVEYEKVRKRKTDDELADDLRARQKEIKSCIASADKKVQKTVRTLKDKKKSLTKAVEVLKEKIENRTDILKNASAFETLFKG